MSEMSTRPLRRCGQCERSTMSFWDRVVADRCLAEGTWSPKYRLRSFAREVGVSCPWFLTRCLAEERKYSPAVSLVSKLGAALGRGDLRDLLRADSTSTIRLSLLGEPMPHHCVRGPVTLCLMFCRSGSQREPSIPQCTLFSGLGTRKKACA